MQADYSIFYKLTLSVKSGDRCVKLYSREDNDRDDSIPLKAVYLSKSPLRVYVTSLSIKYKGSNRRFIRLSNKFAFH